jgi:predicted N-acetyltransferase YhbS
MIEIRTYDGTPEELAAFCTQVWQTRYRDKMPIWLWTGPFLDWELFSEAPGARDFLVAAYDKGRLVGAHPEKPVQYQWRGQPIFGTAGAFFSVDPAYENQAVSLKLVLEQRRRHRERGAQFDMGYLIMGAQAAMGKEFWLRLRSMQVVGKLNLWTRMIDHRALSDFSFSARDRWATRIVGSVQGRPKPPRNSAGIRPYREGDLADCLALVGELSRRAEFGIVWDKASLGHQLDFKNQPRTLVAEESGRVAGFVNYFRQTFIGRREIVAGVIDLLCVHKLSAERRRALLQAALSEMSEAGCHVAVFLGTAGTPGGLLLRTGFIPEPPDHLYVAQAMTPDAPKLKTRRIHAILR